MVRQYGLSELIGRRCFQTAGMPPFSGSIAARLMRFLRIIATAGDVSTASLDRSLRSLYFTGRRGDRLW
jgi:hypothetical protein